MKNNERTQIWPTLLLVVLWILLLANVVVDYIRDRLVTPFSVVMFLALLVGSLAPRLLKLPGFPPPRRVVWLTYAAIFIAVVAWVVYTMARLMI